MGNGDGRNAGHDNGDDADPASFAVMMRCVRAQIYERLDEFVLLVQHVLIEAAGIASMDEHTFDIDVVDSTHAASPSAQLTSWRFLHSAIAATIGAAGRHQFGQGLSLHCGHETARAVVSLRCGAFARG